MKSRKAIVLTAATVLLFALGSCGTYEVAEDSTDKEVSDPPPTVSVTTEPESVNSESDLVIQMYREFLNGERTVDGISMEDLTAKEDDPDWHYTTKYTILDVTGDSVPELHVRTIDKYTILTCKDDALVFLPVEFEDSVNICLLKNGEFIQWDYPGWINPFWHDYCHFTVDESGNRIADIRFEWKDYNDNLVCDGQDDYIFAAYSFEEEKWIESTCSMEEWLEKTSKYLYTDKSRRVQIRKKAEWQSYCENSYVAEDWVDTCPQIEWENFDDGYDILAKSKELEPEIREAFLSRYGFSDAEPFYEYDGYYYIYAEGNRKDHRVELYFDSTRDLFCGIVYWKKDSRDYYIYGIIIDDTKEDIWEVHDPFSTLSEDGWTGEEVVKDYSEKFEYDDEGKLVSFRSRGRIWSIQYEQYEDRDESLIDIDFFYDEQGNLLEKHSWNSNRVFISPGPLYYQYDESGRLARSQSFRTSKNYGEYYIYPGDGDVPAYALGLWDGVNISPSMTVYR